MASINLVTWFGIHWRQTYIHKQYLSIKSFNKMPPKFLGSSGTAFVTSDCTIRDPKFVKDVAQYADTTKQARNSFLCV
jgi:hypothetical protein